MMALVVFLRGVNVGGHKTFQPSLLAKQLKNYDVVNVGAAGTFVVRKPITQAKLRAELLRRLPFDTEIMICSGRDLIRAASGDPFANEPSGPDIVRFVSVLSRKPRVPPSVPISFPQEGEWLLRIIAIKEKFVFGLYRRQMKAISYLTQLDKHLAASATTRNWNTINAIIRILKEDRPNTH
jgi:uncharacterized protein (DUF1697 family)